MATVAELITARGEPLPAILSEPARRIRRFSHEYKARIVAEAASRGAAPAIEDREGLGRGTIKRWRYDVEHGRIHHAPPVEAPPAIEPGQLSGSIAFKNGAHCIALLAGAQARTYRHIKDRLATIGIDLAHHIEYPRAVRNRGSIPPEVDVVIMATDTISHSGADRIVAACRTAGIPFLRSVRKLAKLIPDVERARITGKALAVEEPPAAVEAPAPVAVEEAPAPRLEPEPLCMALDGPIDPLPPPPIFAEPVGSTVAGFIRRVRAWLTDAGLKQITITKTDFLLESEDPN